MWEKPGAAPTVVSTARRSTYTVVASMLADATIASFDDAGG